MNVGCLVKHAPGLGTVRALLDAGRALSIVVTERSQAGTDWHTEMEALCRRHGIPHLDVDRVGGPQSVAHIRQSAPDVMVSVFFTQIVPIEVLRIPPRGIINFHPSLLPAYRGPHPVNWAIIRGETETGLTAHMMVQDVDAGDILRQWRIAIDPEDDLGTVAARIHALIPGAVLETLDLLDRGELHPVPQDPSRASYFPRRTEKDDAVVWSAPGEDIRNLIRGLYRPLPGALAFQGNRRIVLRRAQVVPDESGPERSTAGSSIPGSIVRLGTDGMRVRTGTGVLLVTEIDVDGMLALTPADAVRRGLLDPEEPFRTEGAR